MANQVSIFFSDYLNSHPINSLDIFSLAALSTKIKTIKKGLDQLTNRGFRFGGDTFSDSKACTDVKNKKIFIAFDKSLPEAVLSLAYEITNALNANRISKAVDVYLNDPYPSRRKAEEYAKQILYIEAEAVYKRSKIALKLNLESAIKNPNYLKILLDNSTENKKSIVEKIFQEMLLHGKVLKGTKNAYCHYIEQYFTYHGAGTLN